MLIHTAAIVLSAVKYRESSLIVRCYTRQLGLQSYIVNSVRTAKPRHGAALFQPLTQLDMVVYANKAHSLHRFNEVRVGHAYSSIPFSPLKMAITLFLAEVLGRTIREEEENENLFDFLQNSLLIFDALPATEANFHLRFLLQLAGWLGFGTEDALHIWLESRLPHSFEEEEALQHLIDTPYDQPAALGTSLRRHLLDAILNWYRVHETGLGELKSLPVLQQVI